MAQLVVGPLLNHPALVEDVDAIRILHRGEAVRDDDDRHLPLQRVDAVLDVLLRGGVQVARRLVEQQVRLLKELARWKRSDRVVSDCAVTRANE